MDSQFRFQYNADGNPIQFWIIGGFEETAYFLDFLRKRFLNLKEDTEKKEMQGKLRLGTNKIYEIAVKCLTLDEWKKLADKRDLLADLLAFYQPGNIRDYPIWEEQIEWFRWGKVKSLLFLEGLRCPAEFHLVNKNLDDESIEQRVRQFLKKSQIKKVKAEEKEVKPRDF